MPKEKDPLNQKAWKFSITVPGEMRPFIEAKTLKENYEGVSQHGCALFLYDVCSDRPHRVTGPLMREPKWSRDAIIAELLAEAKAGKTPFGGWFDRIVEERVAQRLKEERGE